MAAPGGWDRPDGFNVDQVVCWGLKTWKRSGWGNSRYRMSIWESEMQLSMPLGEPAPPAPVVLRALPLTASATISPATLVVGASGINARRTFARAKVSLAKPVRVTNWISLVALAWLVNEALDQAKEWGGQHWPTFVAHWNAICAFVRGLFS